MRIVPVNVKFTFIVILGSCWWVDVSWNIDEG